MMESKTSNCTSNGVRERLQLCCFKVLFNRPTTAFGAVCFLRSPSLAPPVPKPAAAEKAEGHPWPDIECFPQQSPSFAAASQ